MDISYRINYCQTGKAPDSGVRRFSVFLLTLLFVSLFALLTYSCWPEGWRLLQSVFIPGDPEVTLHATACFFRELHWGTSLSDALETFCNIIVFHEQIP